MSERKWVRVITPGGRDEVCELHEDGSLTYWMWNVYGAIGDHGRAQEGYIIEEVKSKRDKQRVAAIERRLEQVCEWQRDWAETRGVKI